MFPGRVLTVLIPLLEFIAVSGAMAAIALAVARPIASAGKRLHATFAGLAVIAILDTALMALLSRSNQDCIDRACAYYGLSPGCPDPRAAMCGQSLGIDYLTIWIAGGLAIAAIFAGLAIMARASASDD